MVTEVAYKITVRGLVQGVLFRASARNEAVELGIKGYAKNNPDDSVEIVAVGEPDDIEKFLRWCYIGSQDSKVDSVDVEILDVNVEEFKDFKIEY